MMQFILALLLSWNLSLNDVTITEGSNGAYVIIVKNNNVPEKIIIVKPNPAGGEPIITIDVIAGGRTGGPGNGETP